MFFIQEWSEWFVEQNWTNFHFALLQFEHAAYASYVEIDLGLIGFIVTVEWYYGNSPNG